MLHARRKAEIEVLASASAPARRDEQMRREAMRDTDSSPSTSQSMGSGHGWDSSTPPTSQDVETPPESALVRYLVAKIGDYVGRAKARDE
jgi:hypothetical protein